MRSRDEIQRAHDLLTGQFLAVLEGRSDIAVIEPDEMLIAKAACDALCWVLEHDHNNALADNMAVLEKRLAERGFTLQSIAERN